MSPEKHAIRALSRTVAHAPESVRSAGERLQVTLDNIDYYKKRNEPVALAIVKRFAEEEYAQVAEACRAVGPFPISSRPKPRARLEPSAVLDTAINITASLIRDVVVEGS